MPWAELAKKRPTCIRHQALSCSSHGLGNLDLLAVNAHIPTCQLLATADVAMHGHGTMVYNGIQYRTAIPHYGGDGNCTALGSQEKSPPSLTRLACPVIPSPARGRNSAATQFEAAAHYSVLRPALALRDGDPERSSGSTSTSESCCLDYLST